MYRAEKNRQRRTARAAGHNRVRPKRVTPKVEALPMAQRLGAHGVGRADWRGDAEGPGSALYGPPVRPPKEEAVEG